jgi:hypothetical protein
VIRAIGLSLLGGFALSLAGLLFCQCGSALPNDPPITITTTDAARNAASVATLCTHVVTQLGCSTMATCTLGFQRLLARGDTPVDVDCILDAGSAAAVNDCAGAQGACP